MVRQQVMSVVATTCCLLILLLSGQAQCRVCPVFADVVDRGAFGVADSQGQVMGGCHLDKALIPASLVKIATALAALEILGPEYRFVTELYRDGRDNLYIRGFGDPLLISEEVSLILAKLRHQGMLRINDIYVDDSAFALEHQVPGRGKSENPYDAPVGAVGVNFNSVGVRIGRGGRIVSSEPQTPTVALMRELGRHHRPGQYRLNICGRECAPESMMARYTGELMRGLQRRLHMAGQGEVGRKRITADCHLVYRHRNSHTVTDLCRFMLHYSSNYIANLLFLACGSHQYGFPATWAKGHQAVRALLNQVLGSELAGRFRLEEGAGLSRQDRVTARAMLALLQFFRPHAQLLRHERGVRLKSGTMEGVYNYGGYLANGDAFVILLNQARNTRTTVLDRLQAGKYRQMIYSRRNRPD